MLHRTAPLALVLLLACKPATSSPGEEGKAGGSPLPPAPAPSVETEILMAGKPPHAPLRFVTADVGEQRVVLQRQLSRYGPDPEKLVNESDRWTLVVKVGPGDHRDSFTSTIATETEIEGQGEPAPLVRVEVGPRGRIGDVETLRGEPDWIHGFLERIVAALPEDAVGEGAIWQAAFADAVGPGNDVRVVYELVDIDRSTWHLRGESSVSSSAGAATPPADMKTAAPPTSGVVVQGEFELWWKGGAPLPHRGRFEERRTIYRPEGANIEILEVVLGTEPPPDKGGW